MIKLVKPFPYILLRVPAHSLQDAYAFPQEIPAIFEEGIYLSSPEFWSEFHKRQQTKDKEKVDLSLYKYWIRNCMRCTPYGTFAGILIASITDDPTRVILQNSEHHYRSVRLDMNYTTKIIQALMRMPQILEQVKFYPNNSIYQLGDSLRYAEYFIENDTRIYQLTSVAKTNYVVEILIEATNGATISSLAALLATREQVSTKEAEEFIVAMWHSQLLVPELEPCVSGKEPLAHLLEQLDSLQGIESLRSQLEEIQSLFRTPGNDVKYYQGIEQKLRKLNLVPEVPKNVLQTDLFLSATCAKINKSIVDTIIQQADELKVLARRHANRGLDEFKNKFYSRYEEMEVSLSVALDAEAGIGYAGVNDESSGGGELIDNLVVGGKVDRSPHFELDFISQYVLQKHAEFSKNGETTIQIIEAELDYLKANVQEHHFSDSMYIIGALSKKDGIIDEEHFNFYLSALGGTSAANLLNRFAHGNERVAQMVNEISEKEQCANPDVIFAEIIHLPQSRVGNILLRPVSRDYEIPYVGRSGASAEKQILVDDLLISIQNNEIVLRSKKHNRRVIPRLTTAHNFGYKSLPVYKFLCDLQTQGMSYPYAWSWGTLASLKHLPRVVYKNLILKKATWSISESDIDDLPKDRSEYKKYFQSFCAKMNIPSRVVYSENDNELLIDFDKSEGITLLLHYLKRYKKVQIEEFLFAENESAVTDVNGKSYANELIIPLRGDGKKYNGITDFKTANTSVKRTFSPASEWLYFKVCCGAKAAEKLLKELILPFVENGGEQ